MSTSRKRSDSVWDAIQDILPLFRDIYTIFYCSSTSLPSLLVWLSFVQAQRTPFESHCHPWNIPEQKQKKPNPTVEIDMETCVWVCCAKEPSSLRGKEWLRGFVWGAIIIVMVWWSTKWIMMFLLPSKVYRCSCIGLVHGGALRGSSWEPEKVVCATNKWLFGNYEYGNGWHCCCTREG